MPPSPPSYHQHNYNKDDFEVDDTIDEAGGNEGDYDDGEDEYEEYPEHTNSAQ